MSDHISGTVLLVGAGRMAREYAKVLRALHRNVEVIGRGKESARRFERDTGIPVRTGGLDSWLRHRRQRTAAMSYAAAVIAVSGEQLASSAVGLLRSGIRRILTEKPGGLSEVELRTVALEALRYEAEVYVAYNRRHYASVLAARRRITEDGGVSSFHFDFTERSHLIAGSGIDHKVKSAWLLANSSHVIDLAFYLGGEPKIMHPLACGGLNWHPRASRFSGAGVTVNGALFSYHANWEAPGSWGVEVETRRHKWILRPLEQLAQAERESGLTTPVPLYDQLDTCFKPGLYRLVRTFLTGSSSSMVTIHEQLERCRRVYEPMLGSGQVYGEE